MSISMVSSAEFDNIKSYDEKIGDYGKVTIRNSVLGISWLQLDKVIELELKENSDVCDGFDCYALKEVSMYEKGVLIEDIRFKFITMGGTEYYNNLYYKLLISNGKEWIPYKLGEEVSKGDYQIRLEATLPNMWTTVDWQIKTNGYWLEEWALWTSGLNVDLITYWDMTNTSATLIPDLLGFSNLTIVRNTTHNRPLETAGKVGTSQRGLAANTGLLNVTTNKERISGLNLSFSVFLWVNGTDVGINTAEFFTTENGWDLSFQTRELKIHHQNPLGTAVLKSDGANINNSGWRFIGFTKNESGGIGMYIDGKLNITTVSALTFNGTGMVQFNNQFADEVPNYNFDEVGIWNRSLTNSEITQLYNNGIGLTLNQTLVIELNSPSNNNNSLGGTINFISNSTTSNNLINTTLYVWNTTSQALTNLTTITGITNTTNLSLSLGVGTYKWNYLTCTDEAVENPCSFDSQNNTLNIIDYIENNQTYNEVVTEGNLESFELSISGLSSNPLSNSVFYYNDTGYSPSININGNIYTLSYDLEIPGVTIDTSANFSWGLTFTSGTSYNTTEIIQNITNLGIDNCSAYGDLILNFTMFDEDSQEQLVGGDEQTSVKIDLELFNVNSNEVLLTFSSLYNQTNHSEVCLKNLNDSTYQVNALVEYSSNGRFLEFYNIQNFTLTNATVPLNISLYNLNSSIGQEFKITYKDDNFNTVPGALLQIQRQYVDEGLFKTIEIPKFSSAGYTIGHLIRSDVVYNLVIIRNGTILDSFNNIVANCQTPSLTECEININSLGSSVSPQSYSIDSEFSSSLTYDDTTRTLSTTFAVLSGASQSNVLNVTLYDMIGTTNVCTDTLFSSGGTLSCVVPDSFGNATVLIKVSSGGDVKRKSVLKISQDPDDLYGGSLVFVGLMLFLLVIGMGVTDNPLTLGFMIIFGGILLIVMNVFVTQSFYGTGATILWLIIAMIIIMVKGSNRQ